MNELTKKQNEIKQICKKNGINVSNKWFNRYLYYYAKCTPLTKITMIEVLDVILKNPDSFVFFIYGTRAEFFNKTNK